jgi:hypothetical protein
VTREPIRALFGALSDKEYWVRLGALYVATNVAPRTARALLEKLAHRLRQNTAVRESLSLAVALSRAGADPIPTLAAALNVEIDSLRQRIMSVKDSSSRNDYLLSRLSILGVPRADPLVDRLLESWTNPEAIPLLDRRAQATLRARLVLDDLFAGPDARALPRLARARAALHENRVEVAMPFLLRGALTSNRSMERSAARRALIMLEADAARSLLDIAVGTTVTELDPRRAVKILTGFSDPYSGRAVADAALAWEGTARLAATDILAAMPVEAAVPPLLLSSLGSTKKAGRAAKLLDQVIVGHDRSEASMEGGTRFGWVRGFADTPRPWLSNPQVALPVLHAALVEDPGIPSGDRDLSVRQRIEFLQGDDSLPPPVAAQNGLAAPLSNMEMETPTVRLSRYPLATFPSQVELGEEAILNVQLLATPAKGVRKQFGVSFPPGQDSVELLVVVRASGFEIVSGRAEASLIVPRRGDSQPVSFRLKACDPGEHAIDIKFFSGTDLVGHCVAVSAVGADAAPMQSKAAVLGGVSDDWLLSDGDVSLVLFVETCADLRLKWSALAKGKTERTDLGTSPKKFDWQAIELNKKQQTAAIGEVLGKPLKPNDLDGVMAALTAFGSSLYRQIAPRALAPLLAALPDGALIAIESDADWVSWELLSDELGHLLGERFILARMPLLLKPPSEPAFVAPDAVTALIDRATVVVGDDIREDKMIAKRTFKDFVTRADPLIEADWKSLCEHAATSDIIHFVCHGRSDPQFHLSYREGPAGWFLPDQACKLGLKPGAVVFANACSSAQATFFLGDFQSFGERFYAAGARPFFGTLGPVPESAAIDFAALFYNYFALDGLPAGQAMRKARLEATRLFAQGKTFKVPIWLFYSLYGSASIVRRWRP